MHILRINHTKKSQKSKSDLKVLTDFAALISSGRLFKPPGALTAKRVFESGPWNDQQRCLLGSQGAGLGIGL